MRKPLLSVLLLCALCALLAPSGRAEEPYTFRSFVFVKPHTCTEQMLRQGARFGYNDVQLVTERGTMTRQIIAADKHFEENGLYEVCNELGLSVSLWVHEWMDEEWDPAWGEKPSVDNEAIWQDMRERYARYMDEIIPEVDTYVLTFAETHVSARPLEVKWKVIETINNACRERGKQLIVRTFRGGPGWVRDIQGIPEDVVLQYKIVPWDWNMRGTMNPLVGFAGAFGDYREFVEYDAGGEYWNHDKLAVCWTDILEDRYDYQEKHNITGISVRVDRGGNNVFNHPNAVNIMYLGMRAAGNADEDAIWQAFVREHYGEGLEEEIKDILYPTGQVVAEALCVGNAQFGRGGSLPPSAWRYKNNAENPLSWRLSWRWEAGLMEAGAIPDSPMKTQYFLAQKGSDVIIAKEKTAYETQLESAEKSLAGLQAIKDRLDPGAYQLLDWLLTENILFLKTSEEMQLAWLYAKRAQNTPGTGNDQPFLAEMEEHVRAIYRLEKEYNIGERPDITWRERNHRVPRGAWMNWEKFRGDWVPQLREVANSEGPEEFPAQVGDVQGYPENFPFDLIIQRSEEAAEQ